MSSHSCLFLCVHVCACARVRVFACDCLCVFEHTHRCSRRSRQLRRSLSRTAGTACTRRSTPASLASRSSWMPPLLSVSVTLSAAVAVSVCACAARTRGCKCVLGAYMLLTHTHTHRIWQELSGHPGEARCCCAGAQAH